MFYLCCMYVIIITLYIVYIFVSEKRGINDSMRILRALAATIRSRLL
jgi:hypothetical protein